MRTVGEGNLKKVLWALAAVVIALVVMTWLEPFTQSYQIKTACRLMCTDMINSKGEVALAQRLGQPPRFDDKNVRDQFINRARQAGVKFDAGDVDADCPDYLNKDKPHCFSFKYTYDEQGEAHVCTIDVRYGTDTEPALIGNVLRELPHLKTQQHVEVVQRVNKNY
jgi:hypothetical protein